MSGIFEESVDPKGARLGNIRAIAVTTSSAITDLSASTEIWNDILAGRMIRMRADGGDVYYAFNTANSGTVDQTNTTPGNATQCDIIPAGQFIDVRPPYAANALGQWLILKGSVACTLRISVCSESPHNKMT